MKGRNCHSIFKKKQQPRTTLINLNSKPQFLKNIIGVIFFFFLGGEVLRSVTLHIKMQF